VQLAEMTNLCRELKMRDGFETRGGGGGGGGGRRGSASSASSIRMLKVTSRWWDRGIDYCYDYSYDCERVARGSTRDSQQDGTRGVVER